MTSEGSRRTLLGDRCSFSDRTFFCAARALTMFKQLRLWPRCSRWRPSCLLAVVTLGSFEVSIRVLLDLCVLLDPCVATACRSQHSRCVSAVHLLVPCSYAHISSLSQVFLQIGMFIPEIGARIEEQVVQQERHEEAGAVPVVPVADSARNRCVPSSAPQGVPPIGRVACSVINLSLPSSSTSVSTSVREHRVD